jgi:hypothetical protein
MASPGARGVPNSATQNRKEAPPRPRFSDASIAHACARWQPPGAAHRLHSPRPGARCACEGACQPAACLTSVFPGGAERLIVDAVVELQSRGHDVQLYTAHHDPGRCFSETAPGALPSLPSLAPPCLKHGPQTVPGPPGCTSTPPGCRAPCLGGCTRCVPSCAASGWHLCCSSRAAASTQWLWTRSPPPCPSSERSAAPRRVTVCVPRPVKLLSTHRRSRHHPTAPGPVLLPLPGPPPGQPWQQAALAVSRATGHH